MPPGVSRSNPQIDGEVYVYVQVSPVTPVQRAHGQQSRHSEVLCRRPARLRRGVAGDRVEQRVGPPPLPMRTRAGTLTQKTGES